MPRYVFDIETDGFLDTVTTLHSLVITDVDTGEMISCADAAEHCDNNGTSLYTGIYLLEQADEVIGHNIIKYDIPVLEKLYGFKTKAKVTDTLVLSRLIWPDLYEEDVPKVKRGQLPSRLMASHALEAWGYRLNQMKGEYGKGEDAWVSWNPEMQEYCKQDARVTLALYQRILSKNVDPRAWSLEHRFATLMAMQERNGFCFDEAAAQELYAQLVGRRLSLKNDLQATFPPKLVAESFIPKVNNKTRGYVKGQLVIREHEVEFNPGSRQMIAERLKGMGWVPTEFTETGQPKIDETILAKLPYPEAKLLGEYFLVEKRIGQLAEGDQAWLRLVKGGRIHGSVNTNGAVTGRCTHSRPNIAQVPKVGTKYGKECRALFRARKGWKLVGADLSGLELRCLAHYMAKHDGGVYGKVLLEGDVHTVNQTAAGLPTRNDAKTFIYAFLYGAGDAKIGSIVKPQASDEEKKKVGARLKKSFLAKTPALKLLQKAVTTKASETGKLKGLDGRILKVRHQHAALNTLLQSAGALIAKLATVIAYDNLSTRGFVFGKDYAFVAHVHDELQIEAREELADEVGRTVVESMREAGREFGFRIPIDGEYKVGTTWADTH
jgi:DNA polymerase I